MMMIIKARLFKKVDSGLTIKEIFNSLKLNYQTVARIVNCYLTNGSVEPKKRGGDSCSKLFIVQKDQILSWLDKNCS